MLSKNHHIAQAPAYVHQFSCIGSSCPDTCCKGWKVDIDKKTYKKMRDLKGTELADRVKKYIKINPAGSGNSHAQVAMGPDLSCAMLDEERMCSIQKQLGADYLSHTCSTYPRKIVQYGRTKEMYATLSCPEAARLCLLNESPWALEPMDLNIPIGKPLLMQGGFRRGSEGTISHNFELIRSFSLDISMNRSMPSWKRMLLLGLTCQKIDELVANKPDQFDAHLEQVILESRLAALNGTFSEQVESILPIAKIKTQQAMLIKRMTQARINMTSVDQRPFFNPTFLKCIALTADGYNKTLDEVEDSNDLIYYDQFEKFDASKPHILENYLINSLHVSLFPMGVKPTLLEQWSDMMIRYALIRFYLKGMSESLGEKFGEADCIDLIYSFSKVVEHNSAFLPKINQLLKEEGIEGTATIAILIR